MSNFKIVFSIFVAANFFSQVLGANCPPLYQYKPGHGCYYFGTDELTWFQGYYSCDINGGYMVEIYDQELQSFLMTEVNNIGEDFWISLSDFDNEGSFVWEHSQLNMSYLFDAWATDEPNGGVNENCVSMTKDHFYFWTDEFCELKRRAICYAPVLLNPCGADGVYIEETDRCYKVSQSTMNFNESIEYCRSLGVQGELTELTSPAETSALYTSNEISVGGYFWIGLRGEGQTLEFQWLSGETLDQYTNWSEGYPQQNENYDCVRAYGFELNYAWRNAECSSNNFALCEFDKLP